MGILRGWGLVLGDYIIEDTACARDQCWSAEGRVLSGIGHFPSCSLTFCLKISGTQFYYQNIDQQHKLLDDINQPLISRLQNHEKNNSLLISANSLNLPVLADCSGHRQPWTQQLHF